MVTKSSFQVSKHVSPSIQTRIDLLNKSTLDVKISRGVQKLQPRQFPSRASMLSDKGSARGFRSELNTTSLVSRKNDTDIYEENDKMDAPGRASNQPYFAAEDTTIQLISKWKHENTVQRKISFLLRDFYNCAEDSRSLTLYGNSIVHANKCLIVAELKQSVIEEKIKLILERSSGPRTLQIDKPDVNTGQACLALRTIALPLRAHLAASKNSFVFCVARHQDQVIDSVVFSTAVSRGHRQPIIQFIFDELFENLKTDFQLVIQFYQLTLKDKMKPSKFKEFIKLLFSGKKKSARTLFLDDDVLPPDGHFTVISASRVNTDHEPIAGTSFHRVGSLTINRANGNATRLSLDRYNYTIALCKDHVLLDMALEPNYSKGDDDDGKTYGVHFEWRSLNTDRIDYRQLEFTKFKYTKRSVEILGKYLLVRSKRFSGKLDLGRCLNPANFKQPGIRKLPHAICLLFSEADANPHSNAQPSQHQFVFITSHKQEQLAQFYRRIMTRVVAVRQWEAPMPPEVDGLPSVVVPTVKLQGDINQQAKFPLYAAMLANIKVI